MHELAVTENLLEIALRHAVKADAGKITDIHVVIGDLSSIIDDSVCFYWDIVAKGTIAEGAQIHFQRLHTLFECLECYTQFELETDRFTCPSCKGQKITIKQGKEFYLESIQIESASDA
jgi:hydrogenase nickel incorporation protein HypA/HybF